MKYTLNSIVIFGLLTVLIDGTLCQLPKVRIEMDEVGMHRLVSIAFRKVCLFINENIFGNRKLKYHLHFDSSFVGSNCQYVLSQPLPAAIYISTDELDDLQRLLMVFWIKFTTCSNNVQSHCLAALRGVSQVRGHRNHNGKVNPIRRLTTRGRQAKGHSDSAHSLPLPCRQ